MTLESASTNGGSHGSLKECLGIVKGGQLRRVGIRKLNFINWNSVAAMEGDVDFLIEEEIFKRSVAGPESASRLEARRSRRDCATRSGCKGCCGDLRLLTSASKRFPKPISPKT